MGSGRRGPRSDELGFQAVEDGLEAEFEGILGSRAVVPGRGCIEAGAQALELAGDFGGACHRQRPRGGLRAPTRWEHHMSNDTLAEFVEATANRVRLAQCEPIWLRCLRFSPGPCAAAQAQ